MRNKLTLTALTIAVTMALAAPAQAIIRWERDIESAKQLAKQTRRLVLLHFWSDDCPPCRQLEKNVFPRSEVQRSIAAGYVAVKIHGKQSRHLTEQFDVRGWPTDIIMTPDGREIYRTTSSQDPNKYIRLLDTVVAHARVNKPAQHTAAATAQTPRAATAPNQPPSRFSSSGQGPVSQRRTVNPQATSRYGQPPQRPATNVAQFATRPAPPQPTMRINPYIVRNPSPAPPSGAGAPSRYSGPQAHATRPAGQTPAAQTPVAQNRAERNTHHQTAPVPTDPSSRYGRPSPAQQFAARQQANNPPAAPSAAPSVAQAPSSRQPTIDAPPSARVAYTTGASRYGPPAAGASRSGAPDAAANRYGSPAAPPRQADSRQAASNQTRRPGTSSPVGQNQYGAENRSSYSPPYAEQSRSQTRQSYGSQPSQATADSNRTRQQPPQQQGGIIPPRYGSQAAVTPQSLNGPQISIGQPATTVPPQAPDRNIGMDGFCPVTLQEHRVWRKGGQPYAVVHRGRVFLCAGPDELAKFKQKPDFYCPLLSGLDPVRLLQTNELVDGRREFGIWHKQSMLLFSSEASLAAFSQQPELYMRGIQQAMAHERSTGRWR